MKLYTPKHTFARILIAVILMTTSSMQVSALTNDELSLDPEEQTTQIEQVIEEVFEDLGPAVVKKMITIADCESYGGKDGMIMHIDPNGKIVKNPKSSAHGVFQIMFKGSGFKPLAKRLDLELLEVEDNIKFARVLVNDKIDRGRKNLYEDWVCA